MLSKDEQDRLDEIERALSDDHPLFAANVDFDRLGRQVLHAAHRRGRGPRRISHSQLADPAQFDTQTLQAD